jgi:hypothetical protein
MKQIKIRESKGNTFYIKGRYIPKGCKICLKGAKAVLFLNGLCQNPSHCNWYCPISEKRKNQDVTFADEIQIFSKKDLLEEINKINAKGMSITGGDPLLPSNLEKTYDYIEYVKSVKGKKFHVHLYTNGLNLNEKICKRLNQVGLDEIRFHPPKKKWDVIKLAVENSTMSVGAEVPVIPTSEHYKNLEEFIYYLDQIGADFINLNEFEICSPNSRALKERGFRLNRNMIASVEGSKEMALDLLKKIAPNTSLIIHFCTIPAKDHYQLKNRYIRRAKAIKLPYEEITAEGLLIYARIEGEKEILSTVKPIVMNKFKLTKKYIDFNENVIKLPYYLAMERDFLDLLEKYQLKGYIEEIIPFRGEYCQITEKTPLKIFRQEVRRY